MLLKCQVLIYAHIFTTGLHKYSSSKTCFADRYEEKRETEINDQSDSKDLEERRREGQLEKSQMWEETLSKQCVYSNVNTLRQTPFYSPKINLISILHQF